MSFDTGLIDALLILLGFSMGVATRFKTPIMVLILVLRMAKWYMDTHPHGKEMAQKTNLDEKLNKLFPEAVG